MVMSLLALSDPFKEVCQPHEWDVSERTEDQQVCIAAHNALRAFAYCHLQKFVVVRIAARLYFLRRTDESTPLNQGLHKRRAFFERKVVVKLLAGEHLVDLLKRRLREQDRATFQCVWRRACPGFPPSNRAALTSVFVSKT